MLFWLRAEYTEVWYDKKIFVFEPETILLELTEINTRRYCGGKARPASKADNLIAVCEAIV
jgi:hypothetical protein